MPPDGVAVPVPSQPPLHETLVLDTETSRAAGWFISAFAIAEHPDESVTVTEYTPAHKLSAVAPIWPLDHE